MARRKAVVDPKLAERARKKAVRQLANAVHAKRNREERKRKNIRKRDHKCTGDDRCRVCLRQKQLSLFEAKNVAAELADHCMHQDRGLCVKCNAATVVDKPAGNGVKPAKDVTVYAVFRDRNGIAYLRVAHAREEGAALFTVNKGFHVDLVKLQARTARDLYLQPVVGASILECAQRLLHPLNDNVTISQRAKEHLITIINDERVISMATKKQKAVAATEPTKKFATITAPPAKNQKSKAAKAAKEPKEKRAATSGGHARYAGKKIKVLNKEHGAREGTKRAIGLDILFKSKTTDEALKAFAKHEGIDSSFIRFAVSSGFIKLTD